MKRFSRHLTTLVQCAIFLLLTMEVTQAAEGAKCTANSDCADSEYCNATQICPGNDVRGTCKARPQACPRDYKPVTGCDGVEYANACEAAANGQSVKVKRDGPTRHDKKRRQRNQENND